MFRRAKYSKLPPESISTSQWTSLKFQQAGAANDKPLPWAGMKSSSQKSNPDSTVKHSFTKIPHIPNSLPNKNSFLWKFECVVTLFPVLSSFLYGVYCTCLFLRGRFGLFVSSKFVKCTSTWWANLLECENIFIFFLVWLNSIWHCQDPVCELRTLEL